MTKPIEPLSDRGEEYVDFMIPDSGDDRAVFIGVNGECIRVRPGVPVSVRRKFVEAWRNAQAQERAAQETQRSARSAGEKAFAVM